MRRHLGCQAFFSHGWFKPKDADRAAGLCRDAGMDMIREPLPWHAVEKTEGDIDWSQLDAGMNVLRRHGFKVLALLGTGVEWATSDGTLRALPRREPWERFLKQLVDRYGDVVVAWEASNEPNHKPFWPPQPDPAEYAQFLAWTHEAITATGHPGDILAMNTSYADVDFIEKAFAAGAAPYSSVIGLHPYDIFGNPEEAGIVKGVDAVCDLMAEHGHTPRIWISEMGWCSWPDGVFAVPGEHLAADFQSRSHAMLLGHHAVEALIVHSLTNAPKSWERVEFMRRWGLIHDDWTPKALYHAFATTIAELGDFQPSGRLAAPWDTYAYDFRNGDKRTVIAWTTGRIGFLELDGCDEVVTVVEATGRLEEIPTKDGRLEVRVGPSPMYFRANA